jgi:thiazole synthase ThiGH ThiG subunit
MTPSQGPNLDNTWLVGDTALHSRFLLGTAGYPSPTTSSLSHGVSYSSRAM